MTRLLRITALLAALSAGACAHAPDVAPMLDIADRDCSAAPNLAVAIAAAATANGEREKPTSIMIDAQSPCLTGPAGKSLYALFALPDGGPFTISLSSIPLGRSLFAPKASALDAQGAVIRDLPVGSFMFRGTSLTALYRSHAGERYLLVASDPPSVGKPLARVSESVTTTVVPVGVGYAAIYTGNDIVANTTWSHNGEVAISVVSDGPISK
jgi:hypothetical protein